jgi:DNA-binding GntR family transcriptional regulator
MMNEQLRAQAVAKVAERLGREDPASLQVLTELWDTAFEEGRLAALDEFQDRFCVCMK